MSKTLTARLRASPNKIDPELIDATLEHIENLHQEFLVQLHILAQENTNLKTVMIAAAEEIAKHWDAHCDEEGYGPVNLLNRLEQGIPAQYGYTAGAFERLKNELKAAQAAKEANPTVTN